MTPTLLAELGALFCREADALGGFWSPRPAAVKPECDRLEAIASELFKKAREGGYRGTPFARKKPPRGG